MLNHGEKELGRAICLEVPVSRESVMKVHNEVVVIWSVLNKIILRLEYV